MQRRNFMKFQICLPGSVRIVRDKGPIAGKAILFSCHINIEINSKPDEFASAKRNTDFSIHPKECFDLIKVGLPQYGPDGKILFRVDAESCWNTYLAIL